MMNYDEIIMSLSEIADQPTEDGMVDGINQQTIRDALELINYQHEHIEVLLKDQEKIVLCKDCKYWKNKYMEYDVHPWLPCMVINTRGNWFCANGKRR